MPGKRKKQIYQPIETIFQTEPRIRYLKESIESILSLIDFEKDGRVVEVDGFRLKNLSNWLVPLQGDPASVHQHLARRCNLGCKFCYLFGNPPDIALSSEDFSAPEELATRLKYYSTEGGNELFQSLYGLNELFFHPGCVDRLAELRRKTDQSFTIVTNGSLLDKNVAKGLASIRPVFIVLSLNSCDPKVRTELMGDRNPEVAIKAPHVLKEHGVSYGISIAAWPPVDHQSLEKTIRYADENEACFVRVILPGYSKYFSDSIKFSTKRVWKSIIKNIDSLRQKVDTPIFAVPSIYEMDHIRDTANVARILGVVRNSPAYRAGLRAGDILHFIGGIKAKNRYDAHELLEMFAGERSASITVLRGKKRLSVEMRATVGSYPYDARIEGMFAFPFGIIMPSGFDRNYLKEIERLIARNRARRVLVFVSPLMLPSFSKECNRAAFNEKIGKKLKAKIKICIPRNYYLGGNIFVGNMPVSDDFIKDINRVRAEDGFDPDLVLIPSAPFDAFGDWRRDMRGDYYGKIERSTGVKIELIPCDIIGY